MVGSKMAIKLFNKAIVLLWFIFISVFIVPPVALVLLFMKDEPRD